MTNARATGAPANAATTALDVPGSGLVLCDRDGRVLEVSAEARDLLGADDLPAAVTALVAVVVDPIRPSRLADVVARARGLSVREQDVLGQLARGRSNKQIARALGLPEWTAQDHVEAVPAKFGASGRSELQAALFSGHHTPLHV